MESDLPFESDYESTVCPQCGSDNLEFVYAGGSDTLVCQDCGYSFDEG